MSTTQRNRTVPLTASKFEQRAYSPGEEGIVLTTKVPSNQVWQVPVGESITMALVTKQTFSVNEGTANQVIDLTPYAPMVDYLDDPTAGEYTGDSFIVGYFDSDGDGEPDTFIDGASTVQYNGTFTEDGDFVDSFEVDDTSGGTSTKDVEFYSVQRYGQALIKKRNSGAGNVSQTLKGEDMIRYAFASPYDPSTDRQVTWDAGIGGLHSVIPPKFNLDVVYFDNTDDIHVNAARADNLEVRIPINQRPLKDSEEPATLRQKVTATMTEPNA